MQLQTLFGQYLSFVKKFIPEKSIGSSVGLDIGANSCKMVELVHENDKKRIISWAVERVEAGNVKSAVTKVMSKVKIPSKTPVSAVFGKGTLIRYVDMPRMPAEDVKNSMKLEADKYFPFPANQIYMDCFILDPKAKENKMNVLVAAAKKEIIDERVTLLSGMGLQGEFITLNSIAIANVLHSLSNGKPGAVSPAEKGEKGVTAVAILDMGEVVSSLTILVDNLPRFTRDVFIGGKDISRSISNFLEVSAEEAERLKCQPGEKLADVLSACDSTLMNLISEVRLSFDYFITEKNIAVSQVLLTGGGSMLQGIEEVFSRNLELTVQKWNPLTEVELSPDLPRQELEAQGGRLAVALGLSLYA